MEDTDTAHLSQEISAPTQTSKSWRPSGTGLDEIRLARAHVQRMPALPNQSNSNLTRPDQTRSDQTKGQCQSQKQPQPVSVSSRLVFTARLYRPSWS